MNMMKKAEEMMEKIKNDKDILNKFETNPAEAINSIAGTNISDEQARKMIDDVKAKMQDGSMDKLIKYFSGNK